MMPSFRFQRRYVWGSLLIVLIVAALFRFWQIANIPPGLFGDEATDGLDALDVLAGRGQIFFPANFGREGLHMWIVAAAIKLMGVSPLALRLPSAMAGLLACLGAFWLGWELFRTSAEDRWGQAYRLAVALTAGLIMATSYWHVHFSRFGIRGVFTTAATAWAFAAFWRAMHTQKTRWFAAAGIFLGLGAHFYTASRFAPIVLAVFLVSWLSLAWLKIEHAATPRPRLGHTALMFLVAALIFAPLGYYFFTHPGSFTQRASVVSAFGQESEAAWKPILRAAAANLAQFVVPGGGDQAQFYNLPGRAVFDPAMALLALLGVGISVRKWRQPPYLFLLLWFGLMAVPSFLATDRYPTLPRLLGVIPGVYFFPAIGLVTVWRWGTDRLAGRGRWLQHLPGLVVAAALLLHAGLTWRDYFQRWGQAPATVEAFEGDMTAAWAWLQTHPQPGDIYLSSDLYKHPTFMFLHEQTPTTEYFSRRNSRLHWFDGRSSWPLPSGRDPHIILVGDSAPPPAFIASLLKLEFEPLAGNTGRPLLQRANTGLTPNLSRRLAFTDQLSLLDQVYVASIGSPGRAALVQFWQASGPADLRRPQIQSALIGASGQQIVQVSDWMGYWPAEWAADGVFATWQVLAWAGDQPVVSTALRLVPAEQPPLQPAGSVDGWVTLPLVAGDQAFTSVK